MIKIDKENFKIETDCRTVGEFMTEAAAIYGVNLTIKVDGCRYEFFDNPKIRVTDDTPIGLVFIDGIGSGGINPDVVRITILSKPKPKTVRKRGWVNVYRASFGNYKTTPDNRRPAPQVYNSKEAAEQAVRLLSDPVERQMFTATAKIEWEEVAQ